MKIGMHEKDPPSDNSDIFEFQNYFKNADPLLGSISDISKLENILISEDLLVKMP